MQTRRMIVALFASIAVFYLWLVVASILWPPAPPEEVATTGPAPEDVPAEVSPAVPAVPAEPGPPVPDVTTRPGGYAVAGGTRTEPVVLGNAERDSPFPMEVRIEPRGAAVSTVRIRGHYETVRDHSPYTVIEPVIPPDREEAGALYSFVTPKIRLEHAKQDIELDSVLWELSPDSSDERKIWTVTVEHGGVPVARIVKTYELARQTPISRTHDLGLSVRVENLSDQPASIIVVQRGPVGFRREDTRWEDRKVVHGLWRNGSLAVKGHVRSDVLKQRKIPLGRDEDDTRIAWAAEVNKFFTAIMVPADRFDATDPPRLNQLDAIYLTETEDPVLQPVSGMTFEYATVTLDIPPGQAVSTAFEIYIGPKSRRTFEMVAAYQQRQFYEVIKESFYACAHGGLTTMMMRLLDWFQSIPPRNYGVAIIILVLMVRTILHPITKRAQVNMVKMSKQVSVLQPKLEAIKQKYANDRAGYNQAMMEMYREAGINPAGNLLSCLPLLLQIPIWGALWAALNSTIEMRHAPFDGWWIRDLAGPDALIEFERPIYIPLLHHIMMGPVQAFNLLPILLGVSQILQAKYMPRGVTAGQQTGKAADQLEQQRKMMMFMSGFFVLFLYNAPSGLNLYIMASNLFGILEQWRIRKHLAEEEARKAAEPAPGSSSASLAKPAGPAEPRKPSWLQKKWQELEKQVEEAKRIQSQTKKKARK
jgi:YidC/Oxa1 family membrane protein insertase